MKRRWTIVALLAAAWCGAAPGMALAQGCGAEVGRLASLYNLSSDPLPSAAGESAAQAAPAIAESRGAIATERAVRSQGVLTPPDVGGFGAVVPEEPGAAATGGGPIARAGGDLTDAERHEMETLLAAARDAQARGDAEQCRDRLREAAAVPGVPGARRPQ